MNLFRLFGRRRPSSTPGLAGLISGGVGDSLETAVVILSDDAFFGIQAEFLYISSQCGERGRAWNLHSQHIRRHGDRTIDELSILLGNGEVRTYYFDITRFDRSKGI